MANAVKVPNNPDKRSQSHTGQVNKSSEIQPMIISKHSSDDDQDQNSENQFKPKQLTRSELVTNEKQSD